MTVKRLMKRNSLNDPAVYRRVLKFAEKHSAGVKGLSRLKSYPKMYHLAVVSGLIRPGNSGESMWDKKAVGNLKNLVDFFIGYNSGKYTARHNTYLYRLAKSYGLLNVRRRGHHCRPPHIEAEMDRIVLECHAKGGYLREMSLASGYSHEKCRKVITRAGLKPNGTCGGLQAPRPH